MIQWSSKSMTSRQRVLAALARKPVDRPAAVNPTSVATIDLMDLVGAPFPEANQRGDLMARLAETGHTELGFDSIMPVFSIIQESVAMGCPIDWMEKENWPTCKGGPWKRIEEFQPPENWLKDPIADCVLQAQTKLRKDYPDVAIIGKTMGPWTLAYHIFGVQDFLLMTVDDPDHVKRSLEVLKEYTVIYGQAQIDAGVDALTLPDHATGDLVNAEYYREFLYDIHCELADRIKCPLILHICGRTVDRMPDIAKTGFAAFHFDSRNGAEEAMEAVDDKIALVGNINNTETLFRLNLEKVQEESDRALSAGIRCLGPECAIPLVTPLENLKLIPERCKQFRKDYPNAG